MQVHSRRIAAVVLCVAAYYFARLPVLSESEASRLAGQFTFTQIAISSASGTPRFERKIDSRLGHISGWISSVGASIALGDLDNDGLPNEFCLVDPRTDKVVVAPVPGATRKHSYSAFPLTFDRQPGDSPRLRNHRSEIMAPMGCRMGDLNEDGLLDVLVYFWGRPPIVFMARERTAGTCLDRSSFQAVELSPSSSAWYTNSCTLADLNGDGHLDIVVGNYDSDYSPKMTGGADLSSVMQRSMSKAFNGGKNRFLLWSEPREGDDPINFVETDVDLEPEVLTGWTLAVGAADLDGDLLPEVYFANDFGPDRLLYNCSSKNSLRFRLLNGRKDFATPNSKVLGRDSFKGMGVDFVDLNNDGTLDIFVGNIAGSWSLEESHFAFVSTGTKAQIRESMRRDIAPYRDESESLGLSRSDWSWDTRFGDFNNDSIPEAVQAIGFLKGKTKRWAELHELAMGNDELLANPAVWPRFHGGLDNLSGDKHNAFFARAKDGRYYDIASLLNMNTPYVTRGVATADCDGDGDLDFAIANQWEDSWYFQNNLVQSNEVNDTDARQAKRHPSLVLTLLLPRVVRADAEHRISELTTLDELPERVVGSPAIGATVSIGTYRDSEGTLRGTDGKVYVAQVDGGNGHSGQRSAQLHFGLVSPAFPDSEPLLVDLHWRDRSGHVCTATRRMGPGNYTLTLPSPK